MNLQQSRTEEERGPVDSKDKKRMTAAYLSFAFGFGHLYMRNYRGFVLIISLWLLFATSIVAFFLHMDFFYQGPFPWAHCFAYMFVFVPFTSAIALMIFSSIETDYQCDLRGLTRTSVMDAPIKNYRLGYRLTLYIPYLIVLILTSLTLIIDGFSYFAAEYLVAWTVLCIVGTIFIQRYRNVKMINANVPETSEVRDARIRWESKSRNEKNHDIIKYTIIVLLVSAPFIIIRFALLAKRYS